MWRLTNWESQITERVFFKSQRHFDKTYQISLTLQCLPKFLFKYSTAWQMKRVIRTKNNTITFTSDSRLGKGKISNGLKRDLDKNNPITSKMKIWVKVVKKEFEEK